MAINQEDFDVISDCIIETCKLYRAHIEKHIEKRLSEERDAFEKRICDLEEALTSTRR